MSPESIFTTVNLIAVAGWLLIAIMPRWKYTRMIVLSGGIPLLLAVAYTIIMVLYFGKAEGGFGSLADVMKLFSNEWAVLAGWIHYLAFDLFVGAWEVKDAHVRQADAWASRESPQRPVAGANGSVVVERERFVGRLDQRLDG